MSERLEHLLAAGRWPERFGLSVLLAVARRPRGIALLSRVPPADQAVLSLLALDRYDEPAVARALGWDAAAVVKRGRELRRAQGRP